MKVLKVLLMSVVFSFSVSCVTGIENKNGNTIVENESPSVAENDTFEKSRNEYVPEKSVQSSITSKLSIRKLFGINLKKNVKSLAWSPDGSKLAAGTHGLGAALIWDENGKNKKMFFSFCGTEPSISALAWSPDGNYLAGACNGLSANVVTIWKPDGSVLKNVKNFSSKITALSWSSDSKYIAVGTESGKLKTFAVQSGKMVCNIGLRGAVSGTGWSLNSKYVIASDIKLHVMDTGNCSKVKMLSLPGFSYTMSVAFNRKRFVTGGNDKKITLWDFSSFSRIGSFSVSGFWWIYSSAISADGNYFAAGATSGDLAFWKADNQVPVKKIKLSGGKVLAIAWSSKNKVAVGGELNGITVYKAVIH